MDIEMPGQDGITTSLNIKSLYKQYKLETKIVACSGYSSEKEQRRCLESNSIDEYVTKPITRVKITDLVTKYLYP
jgi:CheY-like chemotaxis protein